MNKKHAIDPKSKRIDEISMVSIAVVSLGIVVISNINLFKEANSAILGQIVGTSLVPILIALLVYRFTRGNLKDNFNDNKKLFIRGIVFAVIALVLWSFTGAQNLNDGYAENVIEDVKTLYNEDNNEFDSNADVKSEVGIVLKKYVRIFSEFGSNFENKVDENLLYTFEDVESSDDFKNLTLMNLIRESFINTSKVYENYFSDYNTLSEQYKNEINGLSESKNSEFIRSLKKGFNENYADTKRQIIKFERISDRYFNTQILLLDEIIENNDLFIIENEQLVFEDDDALSAYNSAFENAIESEEEFLEFSELFVNEQAESTKEFTQILN